MNNVLKEWLVDNTVTSDNKEDKILLFESVDNLSLSGVLSARCQN